MKYKIGRNGQEIGEWTLEEIQAKYQSGELQASDMAWAPGMSNWVLLSQILSGGVVSPASGAVFAIPTPASGLTRPPKPDNNLVWAILVTIFCCWPLGIPSIVFAAKVDSAYASGDYDRAVEMARKSRMWMWIGVGCGIFFIIAYLILVFASGAMGAMGR